MNLKFDSDLLWLGPKVFVSLKKPDSTPSQSVPFQLYKSPINGILYFLDDNFLENCFIHTKVELPKTSIMQCDAAKLNHRICRKKKLLKKCKNRSMFVPRGYLSVIFSIVKTHTPPVLPVTVITENHTFIAEKKPVFFSKTWVL